ncbi:MAG: hypothetical protein QXS00_07095 [Pyrobaculum sp.]|uniref:hypothetical protein n=3 Tax=Pyrobaculum sp. TaxID=2004705 RepID=UPI0031635E6B
MAISQGPCRVFDEEIIETDIAQSVFYSPARLTFVVGYWGYGKTFGIGAYVICKAREKGQHYIYVNMRELRSRTAREIRAMSLFDIFKTIYEVLSDQEAKVGELKNVLETNIADLTKRMSSAKEYLEKDYEERGEMLQALVHVIRRLMDPDKALYMVVDELEGVAPDIRSAANTLCNEARTVYDQRLNFYLYVLMQKALVTSAFPDGKPSCQLREAASGISQTVILSGYSLEDWRKVFAHYGISGDLRGRSKFAQALTKLPPRLIFEILKKDKPTSVKELADIVAKTVHNRREEIFIAPIKHSDMKKIADNLVRSLGISQVAKQNTQTKERGAKLRGNGGRISKFYTYVINCTRGKGITLCVDLRKRRLTKPEIKCDVSVEVDEHVAINGKDVAPTELFLAAFYDKSPSMQGLELLYEEVRRQVIDVLGNYTRQLCS